MCVFFIKKISFTNKFGEVVASLRLNVGTGLLSSHFIFQFLHVVLMEYACLIIAFHFWWIEFVRQLGRVGYISPFCQ